MSRFFKLMLAAVLISTSAQAGAPVCSAVFDEADGGSGVMMFTRPLLALWRRNLDWLDTSSAVAARGQPFLVRMREIALRMPRKVLVTAIPLMPLPRQNRLERVFERVWEDPAYKLTKDDLKEINSARLLENIETMRDTSRRHPTLRFLSKWNGRSVFAMMIAAQALLINHGASLLEGGVLELDEFNARKDLSLDDRQIRIINENHLWPRTAIQLGETVYFYEDDKLASSTLAEFLKQPSRVPGLARSVQMFTLNLPSKDINDLRAFLERRKGGKRSGQWINDGMTQVARLLGSHLPSERLAPDYLLDSSAAFSGLYLTSLKRLGVKIEGRELVGNVLQVDLGRPGEKTLQFARNLWLNTVEANIVIRSAVMNQAVRGAMGIYRGDKDARADVLRAVNDWKTKDIIGKLDQADVVRAEIEYQKDLAAKTQDKFEILVAEMKLEILKASLDDITHPHP